MKRTFENSIQERVLTALFQAHVPTTTTALAQDLGVNPHTVSGVLSTALMVKEIQEVIKVDRSKKVWTYHMEKKSIPVKDMMVLIRRNNQSRRISREGQKAKANGSQGKLDTGKETILVNQVNFPKGTSLRLTGDILVFGVSIFLDLELEVVKRGAEKK